MKHEHELGAAARAAQAAAARCPAPPDARALSALGSLAVLCVAALLAGCAGTPAPAPAPVSSATPRPVPGPGGPQPSTPISPVPAAPIAAAPPPPVLPKVSGATNPRDYRRDGAGHIYALNAHRIWQGQLQPNLYAIGVLQVDLDRQGRVTSLRWMRAPSHAPEVVAEIERTVRQASPFPAPARMGRVTYTDTWLWDKSGKFQLDTLTEGQL